MYLKPDEKSFILYPYFLIRVYLSEFQIARIPDCQSGKVSICCIRSIESPTRGAEYQIVRVARCPSMVLGPLRAPLGGQTITEEGGTPKLATGLDLFHLQQHVTFQLELCKSKDNREYFRACMSPSLSLSLVSVVIRAQSGTNRESTSYPG